MTAVGDAIRSMIGKPKKKNRPSDRREKNRSIDRKKTHPGRRSWISRQALRRVTWPPAEIMEIDLPGGWNSVEACEVAKSKIVPL
jgi:hypothetical protein